MRRAHKQIGVSRDKACAYCRLHKAKLSPKQMKNRDCLKKECWHLIRYSQHPIWQQREREKELKKQRKEERRRALEIHTVPASDPSA